MRVSTWVVVLSVWLWASDASLVHAGNNVWTSLGPAGAAVRVLAIDPRTPTTLYAATFEDGVFKGTNGGSSWSAGLSASVLALAIGPRTPTTLFAGAGDGVFKSTDGGSSWSTVNTGLPNNTYIGA